MEPRKILILTNRIPYPLKDGGNLAMNAMIDGYRSSGWQVYLLSMNTSRHKVAHKVLEQLYTNLYAFEWVNIDNEIKWLPLLKNFFLSSKPEHAERFYQEPFREKLKQVMDSFTPDVVQVESIFMSGYIRDIKETPGIITVLRLHNIEYHIWQSLSLKTKNWLKRYYFKNLTGRIRHFEKSSWRKYDLLLPITQKDANTVLKLDLHNELFVAPFGIDIDKLHPKGVTEKWVGYHIGAMDWIPNRDGILWFLKSVWPKVHKVLPKFEFYFAGRDMPQELKAINEAGVFCMDEVPSADDFIADKKILIVPLGSGSGIRVKILEAMAVGKVVISTVNGIKGIEAKHGVHYLLANRPEDFLRSIKWCLENKQEAEEIGANARNLIIKKYNYLTITKNISNVLERLIVEKGL